MSKIDPHVITSAEELRELVGNPPPGIDIKVTDHLDSFAMAFVERCPFLVLATSDPDGHLDASPKGDGAGFVFAPDDRTLVIPDRPGNKLVFGHLNILQNPYVGMILMIPGTPETLRINGRAELTRNPELLQRLAARGRPAVVATRVHIDECFFHCAKAFIRSDLWKPERWGERHRVSFGEMFGAGNPEAVKTIDAAIEAHDRVNL